KGRGPADEPLRDFVRDLGYARPGEFRTRARGPAAPPARPGPLAGPVPARNPPAAGPAPWRDGTPVALRRRPLRAQMAAGRPRRGPGTGRALGPGVPAPAGRLSR